jgi:hypothetical protein
LHPECKSFDTQHNGILNAEAPLCHAILNGAGTPAGDFFFSIKVRAREKDSSDKIVSEVGSVN